MRIAFIVADSNGCYTVPAVKGGAVTTLVERLVEQNNKKKLIDMEVFSFHSKEAEQAAKEYSNVKINFIKTGRFVNGLDNVFFSLVSKISKEKAASYKSIFSLIYYIMSVSRILRKSGSKYDALILENNIPISWIIKFSRYKGKYYYHLHNVPRINAKCQSVFDECTKYMCVSNYVASEICSSSNAIGPQNKERTSVVRNCIDIERFRRIKDDPEKKIAYYKKKYSIRDDERVILFTGRLSREKGVDILLRSLDHVKYKNYKVLIVGSVIHNTSYKDEYQREIAALSKKYENKVIFTGYIKQEELPYIYNLADISVLPSMWEEPAGLTMIESLSCGTPVITTDSGGIPEYVGDSAVVIRRDEHLIKNIAKTIDRLFADDDLLKHYSLIGEERARKYSSDIYLEKMLDALGANR